MWETSPLDLSRRSVPYSEIWPTSGMARDGSAYLLPSSVLRIPGSASSSSPVPLFRTRSRPAPRGEGNAWNRWEYVGATIALSHQIIDLALNGPNGSPQWRNESETLWSLINVIFTAGDDTQAP